MNVLHICRRELLQFFCSPLAWIVLTLFLLVQGYSFYLLVELLGQPLAPHGPVMQVYFGGSFLFWLSVIFIVPALTMRLVAEERRSGTLEILMAAPVRAGEVILGKYLAALGAYGFLWAPTVVFGLVLSRLAGAESVGWGPILAGYLGVVSLGCAFLAVGLLASALTRSQIVAAVLTFALLTLCLLLGPLDLFLDSALLGHLDLFEQMEDFSRGIVDTRHLVLHGSIVVFCLAAAVRALEARRCD